MCVQYKKRVKFILFLLFTALTSVSFYGQTNSEVSPYSRFGIGEVDYVGSNIGRSLGNTGIALLGGNMINSANPASYASVEAKRFVFDFASSFSASWAYEKGKRDARLLGNIEYVKMLFPTTKWLAFSLGMKPYSTVGYKYGKEMKITMTKDRLARLRYIGKGNLNCYYLGLGVLPFKNFYLGANIGYVMGKISHIQSFSYNNSYTYDKEIYDVIRLGAFNLDLGVQYIIPIKEDKKVILGATYSPSFSMKSSLVLDAVVKDKDGAIVPVEKKERISKNAYKSPHNIGLGIAYQANSHFLYTLDSKYLIWKNSFANAEGFQACNQWFLGAGMAYTPNVVGKSFWNRIEYRCGLNVQNSYVKLEDFQSKKYTNYYKGGLSFGLGIPVSDRKSYVDLTFDYRLLMPENLNMVRNNYFRITIGLRFNENWFKQIRLN